MKRSSAYNYAAYAALPTSALRRGSRQHLLWMLPIGTVAGLILVFCIYFGTMQQISLPAQLRYGLKKGELFLLYQPIVDLNSGRWVGAEALLRWQLRDGTTVSPEIFIPMAERRGMSAALTAYVLRTFARDAAALLRAHPDFFISLNFAPADLEDPASVERLSRTVRDMGIRTGNVHVEATERVFMNAEAAQHNLRDLRRMGFHVAIDDFGTGYSSLSYLTSLEVDSLKIDKAFVSSIGTGSATSHVVFHIIDMARSLRLSMIAEGVETQAQADYLREHGVQYAQGWLYARPLPVAELAQKLGSAPA
jgi:sensor c-di-GMP phosphodiesterase-like protein